MTIATGAGATPDRYRALLAEAGADAAAAAFITRQHNAGLVYDGRPICSTVQPRFLSRAAYDDFRADGEIGARLIALADAAFRARPALRDEVFGAHPYRALIDAHADFLPEPVGRFDALVDRTGRAMFIEYNAGLCGGLYFAEALADLFDTLPPMRRLRAETTIVFERTQAAFVAALVDSFARDFDRQLARIVFLVPDGPAGAPYADHAEVRLMRDAMARQGIDSRVAPIGDTRFTGAWIDIGDWRADAALVFDWLAILGQPAAADLLRPATTAGSWIVNSLGAAIYRGGKHLFALLSDPATDLGETAAERAWIDRTIPWTRLVRAGRTTGADGRAVDLEDHLCREQRTLVIKPCLSMGARGVVLGWQVDAATWSAAIARALAEPTIVQARVAMATEPYACPAPGGVIDAALDSDLCCYVWQQTGVRGLHCRVSTSGLMNVGLGGASVVPVFVTG